MGDYCEFDSVTKLPNGLYRHVSKCGLVRVHPLPDRYQRVCDKACDGRVRAPLSIGRGPGTELSLLLTSLAIRKDGCGSCDEMLAKMNAWGSDGCREHREEIIDHLEKAYDAASWSEVLTAAGKALGQGLFTLDPRKRSILGLLVDEAIRRASLESSQAHSTDKTPGTLSTPM